MKKEKKFTIEFLKKELLKFVEELEELPTTLDEEEVYTMLQKIWWLKVKHIYIDKKTNRIRKNIPIIKYLIL